MFNAQETTDGKSSHPHPARGFRQKQTRHPVSRRRRLERSKNAAGQTPPDADQLRDILAERFFAQPMKTRDVMAVAEMAIASSGGAPLVFNEIRRAFDGFQPSKAHKLIRD